MMYKNSYCVMMSTVNVEMFIFSLGKLILLKLVERKTNYQFSYFAVSNIIHTILTVMSNM